MSRIFALCVCLILGFGMLILLGEHHYFSICSIRLQTEKTVVSKKGTPTSLLNGFPTWIYFKHNGTCHPFATVFSKLSTMIIGNTYYWFQSRDRHSDHLSLLDILDLWAWIYANLTVTFYFHVHGSLWRCLFSMFLLSGAICGRRSETVTQFYSTQYNTL